MNKYQKETEKVLLDHEQKIMKDLKNTYTNALKEIKLKVKQLQSDVDILEKSNLENKSLLQSKIYQLNYQKAMQEQIDSILDVVKNENVTNTQSFLTKVYEDSFLGINYNLQQKGIPVIMPINNKLVVKAITKPTQGYKFTDRLYAHNEEFKKAVTSEISRGLALGSSYSDIAEQLSLVTKVDFNKAYRIARTEGGRVSSEAKLRSMYEAKKQGADIVKVWDATLDHRTREIHSLLDQQVAELDEPFKVQGIEVMAPHGFGRADLDVNCRCVLLSVPRWDLEDEVVKYDNENDQLIKVKNYDAWKNKYYEKLEELDVVRNVITGAETRIAGYKKIAEEISKKVDKVLKPTNVKYDDSVNVAFDSRLLERTKYRLDELTNKYPLMEQYVNDNQFLIKSYFEGDNGPVAYTQFGLFTEGNDQVVVLNKSYFKEYDAIINKMKTDRTKGWCMDCADDYLDVYTVTHEYGHVVHNYLMKKYLNENPDIFNKFDMRYTNAVLSMDGSDAKVLEEIENEIIGGFMNEIKEIALKKDADFTFDKYLSDYGKTTNAEGFAEAFANSQCGKPNVLGDAMNEWLEKRLK